MWSLGVTMYIMLSASSPFPEDQHEQNIAIMNGDFDFPPHLWDDISEEGKDLIKWLMKVDPEERFSAQQALQHVWFDAFFPNRNLPEEKRTIANAFKNALDEAQRYDGLNDDDAPAF